MSDAPVPPMGSDPTLKKAPEPIDKTLQQASTDPTIQKPPADFSIANFGPVSQPPIPGEKTTLYTERGDKPAVERPAKSPDPFPPDVMAALQDPKNLLNQYVLVKLIGKGGMGTVWKAFDRNLKRWAAIKFLIADGNDEGVLRFRREAELSASLRHPNIAPVFDVGEAKGQHFLAMEFIDGVSLAAAELTISETVDIFIKVCQGVEAAHKKGIVHRDLKPQNVMLTVDKWPYVMDFGLAKALDKDSSISVTGAIMGTPAYMPPEQAQGKSDQIDNRTDVYSLGATMYAVLTRKPPFAADSAMDILMKVCTEEPAPPRSVNPQVPVDLETIVLKAMSKRREDRYASAALMAEDLLRFQKNEEIQATRPSSFRVAVRKVRRNPAIIAVAVSLVIAGVAIVVMMNKKDTPSGPNTTIIVAPTPSPKDPKEEARLQRLGAARDQWKSLKDLVEYKTWKAELAPKSADAAKAAAVFAADVKNENDLDNFVDWWDKQLAKADDEFGRIRPRRADWIGAKTQVERIRAWTSFAEAATAPVKRLAALRTAAGALRAETEQVLAWKGLFSLKFLVAPYAKVASVTRDGKPVEIGEVYTPAVLKDLEIGDYVIVLEHPEQGRATVRLAAGSLKNGRTCLVSGKMAGGAVQVSE